jgi:hypothetical protein
MRAGLSMSAIGTDRKLELIRRVRMEQHQNRNTLSNREYLLYGKPRPLHAKGELYGLEATTAGTLPEKNDALDGNMLKSFKFRLIIAVVLFAAYVFIDQANITILGVDAAKIHGMINDGFDVLAGFFADVVNR